MVTMETTSSTSFAMSHHITLQQWQASQW